MYEPRSLEKVREEVLFLITDLSPNDPNTPALIEKYTRQTAKENIIHKYSFGDCAQFAAVTHLILGCPIVELQDKNKGETVHILVEIDGQLMDIEGFLTQEQLTKKYGLKKSKILRNGEETECWINDLNDKLHYRYKANKPSLDMDIEAIVRCVADSIYYLKPGAFKKSANLRKMVSFMNQFYHDLEQCDNKIITRLPCLEVKKDLKLKMKIK